MNAISRAINIVGGASPMAKSLGVTVQAVCFWRDEKRTFPAEKCISVEKLTNQKIRCEDLRPDVDWGYLRGTARDQS